MELYKSNKLRNEKTPIMQYVEARKLKTRWTDQPKVTWQVRNRDLTNKAHPPPLSSPSQIHGPVFFPMPHCSFPHAWERKGCTLILTFFLSKNYKMRRKKKAAESYSLYTWTPGTLTPEGLKVDKAVLYNGNLLNGSFYFQRKHSDKSLFL